VTAHDAYLVSVARYSWAIQWARHPRVIDLERLEAR
jgi:hypothetical protein